MMYFSSPGRICIFGEHQDYLGLPIIAMAISLRCFLKGELKKGKKITIHKPDLNKMETFSLNNLTYTKSRDYFKSGIRVCMQEGLQFSNGFEVEISSDIPIQAGCGSSSAIMVNWIHFLCHMADNPAEWDAIQIGKLAHKAEVQEFNEPGGMMDQYSSAVGSLIYLESKPDLSIEAIQSPLGTFILGDSREPKDTLRILRRCRDERMIIINKLKQKISGFKLSVCSMDEIQPLLDEDEAKLIAGTLKNKCYLEKALKILRENDLKHVEFGKLLTQHHKVLRDCLKVSTPKIEKMLDVAMNAGALGGKVNGSGGGGSMFVYSPDNSELVAEAIENAGGKAYIIQQWKGTKSHLEQV